MSLLSWKVLSSLLFVFLVQFAAAEWGPLTIDSSGSVGKYTSLAIVNGKPAISYYNQTNGALKYVQANNTDGSIWFTPVTIDSSGIVGHYTSLVVVNGKPAISYFDATKGDLKYVQANNTDGSTWSTPVTVDSSGTAGHYTSLAIVNGQPAIRKAAKMT
jgi:hypothetical protein